MWYRACWFREAEIRVGDVIQDKRRASPNLWWCPRDCGIQTIDPDRPTGNLEPKRLEQKLTNLEFSHNNFFDSPFRFSLSGETELSLGAERTSSSFVILNPCHSPLLAWRNEFPQEGSAKGHNSWWQRVLWSRFTLHKTAAINRATFFYFLLLVFLLSCSLPLF